MTDWEQFKLDWRIFWKWVALGIAIDLVLVALGLWKLGELVWRFFQ